MPNGAITDGRISSYAYTSRTTNPRTSNIRIISVSEWGGGFNRQFVDFETLHIRYYGRNKSAQTRTIDAEDVARKRVSLYWSGGPGTTLGRVDFDVQLNEAFMLPFGSMYEVEIEFADSTTVTVTVVEGRRFYLSSPDRLNTQDWVSYLNAIAFTGRSANYAGNEALLAITNNFDRSAGILDVNALTGFENLPPSTLPMTIDAAEFSRRLIGQWAATGARTALLAIYPYAARVSRTITISDAGSVTEPVEIGDSEPDPVEPARQRFDIVRAVKSSVDTQVNAFAVAIPSPPTDFASYYRLTANNRSFANATRVNGSSWPANGKFTVPAPTNGTYYFKFVIVRTDSSEIESNVWKFVKNGSNFEIEEIPDYRAAFSHAHVTVKEITNTEIELRFEDDNILVLPVDSIKVTAQVGSGNPVESTARPSNNDNYVDIGVSGLAANTTYLVKVYAVFGPDQYLITQFEKSTRPAISGSTTDDQKAEIFTDNLLESNLDHAEVDQLRELPVACRQRVIEQMLALKGVATGNTRGIDLNPINNQATVGSRRYAGARAADANLRVNEIIAQVEATIPDPNEDTDLIVEARF